MQWGLAMYGDFLSWLIETEGVSQITEIDEAIMIKNIASKSTNDTRAAYDITYLVIVYA